MCVQGPLARQLPKPILSPMTTSLLDLDQPPLAAGAESSALILASDFKPAGDQPQAIADLTRGVQQDEKDQVLLGVTGSGKTFTVAHLIQNVQRPTLI